DPAWVDASAQQWIEERVDPPDGRALAAALVRLTTYCGRLDLLSADAAIAQLRSGLKGVTYLHGGWATLVAAIAKVAHDAGAGVAHGKVTDLVPDGDRWTVTIRDAETGDDSRVVASSVVLAAGGPAGAAELAGASAPSLRHAADQASPVHAACL